ncbi:AMP-binding protein [Streptomyces aurantiogriseus]|uniref:AMP-dependent synthetase n=1 Tax=Streptomyces aurantiogriseus TaxID=66870 RepID=A0A918CMP2_9ACTN|nr:AMP-binding protein [Streptomyces aurantiogriseus]GGR31104.1 AMP-dependent synthetase [Streptomyces aurantiogriseus]
MLTASDLLQGVPGATSPLFARRLATHGDRIALLTGDGELSYRELAEKVAQTAARLGVRRRLVLLVGANTADALVTYLAALAAGHPVLLVPGDNDEAVRSLTAAYDPDVVARPDRSGRWQLDERRTVSAHQLHPDLALLLSTSGSTGSPKLVRLSYENLQANAESIATYLGIRKDDRAATTLPLHYCYGLSVINSHLLRGAGLLLTGLSVADDGFWNLFRAARATTFAAVPYTFDLLDRTGFAELRLPHLRYITQAGGRLAPDRVAHYAELGRRGGWDLYVMYGQTEATARMAYLPPRLAASHPEAIGVPIPGGSFRLEAHPDRPGQDTGELVYSGPNVMLGYAERASDLALGRTTHELHTGDIARRTSDGLYEIVGRSSRFVKILGLRIDPERVEALLHRHGLTAFCAGADDELVVAVAGGNDTDAGRVRRLVTGEFGLPPRAVAVHVLPELPRLATGKPDYETVRKLGRGPAPDEQPSDLCTLYAEILDRADVTEDSSFVSLGGDSLSYVEMSLNLERVLGQLPPDWHTTPIRDLRGPAPAQPAPPRGSRRRTLETGIALRAATIVLIVGSHIHVFYVKGGAHLLLAVAGFNLARFHLTPSAERRERVRHGLRSISRIVLPSLAWIALVLPLTDDYGLTNLVLLHSVLGPHDSDTAMHFWFIEALTYILVAAVALLGLRIVDRAERRFPFALPMTIAALGLLTRYDLLGLRDRIHLPSAAVVFWLFALGWAAAKADTTRQRALVTVAAVATIPGFFPGEPFRDAVIAAGFVLLVWVRSLPSLDRVNTVAGVLASSSLYIYLTHWQIYPLIEDFSGWLALLASLLFGIGYAAVASWVTRRVSGLRPTMRRPGQE